MTSQPDRPVSQRASRLVEQVWWRTVPVLVRVAGPTLAFLHRRAWLILLLLIVAVLLLGTSGFYDHLLSRQQKPTISEVLYLTLQLFTLESGANIPGDVEWRLEAARYLGAFVMVAAAARALATFFHERFYAVLLKFFGQDHVIVCGLGRKGSRLVEALWKRGEWVVVIDSDVHNDAFEKCRELGATIVVGCSNDEVTLRKARVGRARAVISVIGSDGANVDTAVIARHLSFGREGSRLRCVIHVTDPKLRMMLSTTRLAGDETDAFELEYFDVFEMCARVMLRESQFLPAVRDSFTALSHPLVVGFGQLGETLVLRAIKDWQIDHPQAGEPLRITVIDMHAHEKEKRFRRLHPELCDACSLTFLEMEVHQPEFEKGGFLTGPEGGPEISAVYVCLSDDSLGMLAALTLESLVRPWGVPVIIRMSEEAGFAAALTSANSESHEMDNIRAVGLLELSCNVDLVLDGSQEILARAIHQGYVRHHLQLGETTEQNSSLVPWEDLSEELRHSNRDRAQKIRDHLREIGCHVVPVLGRCPSVIALQPDEVEHLARLEHERWRSEHRRPSSAGRGSQLAQLHLLSWDECPDDVKQFNREMMAVMPAILAKADFEIRRLAEPAAAKVAQHG
jgi:TrkA-N domain